MQFVCLFKLSKISRKIYNILKKKKSPCRWTLQFKPMLFRGHRCTWRNNREAGGLVANSPHHVSGSTLGHHGYWICSIIVLDSSCCDFASWAFSLCFGLQGAGRDHIFSRSERQSFMVTPV